jgi:excisionase family DNA binding protein
VTAPVHLDGESTEAIARRVAELLRDEGIGAEWVSPTELAQRLGVSRDYVYEHAEELGAIRLGHGSRARLRFDLLTVRDRLTQPTVRDSESPQRGNPKSVRRGSPVDLLPIKGERP